MCIEVVTRWPCGHRKSHHEFCDKAKPKKRIVFFRLAKPKGDRPLVPCAELTKRTDDAPPDTRCPEQRCKERLYWMCCKCPALPAVAACEAKTARKTRKGKAADHAPYAVMSRPVLASLNAGWRCGSSDAGTPNCGHRRCGQCQAWRRCRCGCGCRHMIPLKRHVCRVCVYAACRAKAQGKHRDKAAEALDMALANLRERMETLTVGQKEALAGAGKPTTPSTTLDK